MPKVADFGLALRNDPEATWSHWVGPRGTPLYMAPEIMLGGSDAVTAGCDVYSLGALLYRLMAGRAPARPTARGTAGGFDRLPCPLPPSEFVANLPGDLERICLTCLATDPARRYETAAALADDLDRYLAGTPIQGRSEIKTTETEIQPSTGPDRIGSGDWRSLREALLSVAATLVAPVAIGLFMLSGPPRDPGGPPPTAEARAAIVPGLVEDRIDLTVVTKFQPSAVHLERLNQVATRELDGLRELRRQGPLSQEALLRFGTLAQRHGCRLGEDGRYEEASARFREALDALTEHRRRFPGRELAHDEYVNALYADGLYAIAAGEDATALDRFDVIIDALTPRSPNLEDGTLLAKLSQDLNDLSYRHRLRGESPQAQEVSRRHEAFYTRLSEWTGRSPALMLLRASYHASQGHDRTADDDFQAAIALRENRGAAGDSCASLLPRIVATRALHRTWFRDDPGGPADEPERAARALLERLNGDLDAIGIERAMVPELLPEIASHVQVRATTERREGRADLARRTAECFLALAEQVAEAHPESVSARFGLCEATLQMAKNAWEVDIHADVRRWLNRSLEAAHDAQRLAPAHPRVEYYVNDRAARLVALEEAELEAGTTTTTAALNPR